jgi:putative endonuclease
MPSSKRFVYILNSESNPRRFYTGLTAHVADRIASHNRGENSHTANGRPWRAVVVIEFAAEARAVAFERYLKSGSGCAFARRHFR